MDLIVNVTENWGIGCQGRLLVSISADLRRFRQLTEGRVVILGRKTLETFPADHSEQALFELLRQYPRESLCVIGGASVYRLLLPYCDTARVTKTLTTVPADAFFPDLDALESWRVCAQSELFEENGLRFRYYDYVNLTPRSF